MKSLLFATIAWISAILLGVMFLALIVPLFVQGASELSLEFLLAAPHQFGLEGGIGPILCSTLLILLVAIVFAFLPSFATAFFLYFHTTTQNRLRKLTLFCLKLLASVPSIVFGMFGMVVFCEWMGFGFSILSGGLTLAVMIIPTLCFSIYSSLVTFPAELQMASTGLSLGKWTQMKRLIIPHSSPGIAAGMILGVARSISETAALIYTSGYATRYPRSLLDSGRSLSIHIYEMGLNVAGGDARSCAAALVLLMLLLIINLPIQLFFRPRTRQPNFAIGY